MADRNISAQVIIGLVLALVLIGALLSTGLTDIIGFQNQNVTIDDTPTLVSTANPTIANLFSVVLPIMAVIGLILLFIPKNTK